MCKTRWSGCAALLPALVVILATTTAPAKRVSHIGRNQKVLVICVKFSDTPTSRLATADDWVDLLNNEVGTFIEKATHGKTTFKFETPNSLPGNGWLALGYSRADHEFHKTTQKAIDLVDHDVDFRDYHRICVVTASPDPGGDGVGFQWWRVEEEEAESVFVEQGKDVWKRCMSASMSSEWVKHNGGVTTFDGGASYAAHELGHQLETRTHYAPLRWHPGPGATRYSIGWWCLMGLSPGLNHFIGWCKADREWIPGWPCETDDTNQTRTCGPIRTCGPPSGPDIDETVTLIPQEVRTGGVKLIAIPLTAFGSPPRFLGYVVENRRRLNGDRGIPEEGVLVTLVDESPNLYSGRRCIVMDDPDHPGLVDEAALEVGDTFSDATHNLTVTVTGRSGDDYDVRIQYRQPPIRKPDVMISPWNAPPWETPDIWIDSEKNGWDTYRYRDQASGEPIGNGDDAWVSHMNRVWVRVRNIGKGDASNVRVKVYVNDQPNMGASESAWKFRGMIVFPSIAAESAAEDWLPWTPTESKHTCIRAEILELPGDRRETNNSAQENVTHFETSRASPYEPVHLTIHVHNPFKTGETPVIYNVSDIPEGWAVELEPPQTVLAPGGLDSVTFSVYPSGTADWPVPEGLEDLYQPGYVGRLKIEALAPYADTHVPIGGVDVWTHLVRRTRLSLVCDPSGLEVQLSGQLESALSNSRIAIEFTDEGGRDVRFLTTDLSGNYAGTIGLPREGAWRAQALFAGDDMSASAESDVCRFELVQPGD